jgi:lipopolysaccharide exporter
MSDTLRRSMATGAIWMVLFKLVERSLGLISTLILARLLGPADFGVVAMAISFIAMAELLTAFSFDIAIIQNQSATKEHYNSAWTCNVLLNLCVTTLMLALAIPIAAFYRHPEVAWVVCALAFGPFLAGLENIGVVAFRKELDFRREFRFQVSRKLIAFMVVVPLAFILRSYWALVVGMLVSKAGGTVISYLMHPFRPRFTLSKVRELFRFSRWMLFNSLVGFFKERSTDFFIGRLHGSAALGSYNVGVELAHLPTTEIGAPINRALLPGFAKIEQAGEVASAYSSAVGVLALLALPAAALILVLAPFLVPALLGLKWLEAVPVMQIMAFNGALLLFHASICTVLVGRGFPLHVGIANSSYVIVLLALLFVFATHVGVVGAAYAALLTSLLCTPVYLYQVKRCLGISPGLFLRAVMRPLLACAATTALLRWALPYDEATTSTLLSVTWLFVGAASGLAIYSAVLWCLWSMAGRPDGAERAVIDRLRSFVSQRSASPPAAVAE